MWKGWQKSGFLNGRRFLLSVSGCVIEPVNSQLTPTITQDQMATVLKLAPLAYDSLNGAKDQWARSHETTGSTMHCSSFETLFSIFKRSVSKGPSWSAELLFDVLFVHHVLRTLNLEEHKGGSESPTVVSSWLRCSQATISSEATFSSRCPYEIIVV